MAKVEGCWVWVRVLVPAVPFTPGVPPQKQASPRRSLLLKGYGEVSACLGRTRLVSVLLPEVLYLQGDGGLGQKGNRALLWAEPPGDGPWDGALPSSRLFPLSVTGKG